MYKKKITMLCGQNLVNNSVRKVDLRKKDHDKCFLELTAKLTSTAKKKTYNIDSSLLVTFTRITTQRKMIS